MHLARYSLENFRNFKSLDLKFNQGFLVFTGPNGAGKTNFLEGIYFGASLLRFPESKFDQLFLEGKDFLRVRLETLNEEQNRQEVFAQKQAAKYLYQFKINNQTFSRRDYPGYLPVVSFLPQDLNLFTGSPARRRRYLNEISSAVSAEYRFAFKEYEKVLRQRNDLLENIKIGNGKIEELEIWDEQLAVHGSVIAQNRKTLFQYLNAGVGKIMDSLSPEMRAAEFVYNGADNTDRAVFLEKIRQARDRELALGATLTGPHRDDFETTISGKRAVGYVSRGQLRSLALGLKILEKEYLEEQKQTSPVMLLDDVFSEFDSAHQQKLVEFLRSFEQVFITTAHMSEIKAFLPSDAKLFSVDSGIVSPYVQ